jgi:hypothetical protein
MKRFCILFSLAAAIAALGALAVPAPAQAIVCAAGVYKAGCAGPNGAVVTNKRPPPRPTVTCARGVYHAGCVRRY